MALFLMVQPDTLSVHTLGFDGISRPRKEKLFRDIIAGTFYDLRGDDLHLYRT